MSQSLRWSVSPLLFKNTEIHCCIHNTEASPWPCVNIYVDLSQFVRWAVVQSRLNFQLDTHFRFSTFTITLCIWRSSPCATRGRCKLWRTRVRHPKVNCSVKYKFRYRDAQYNCNACCSGTRVMMIVTSLISGFRCEVDANCALLGLWHSEWSVLSSGVKNLEFKNLGILTPEDGTDKMSRNVSKELRLHAA